MAIGLLRRCQFDHVVDTQDGDGGLRGKLQTLDLAYAGLENTGRLVVPNDALDQVKSAPARDRGKGEERKKRINIFDICHIITKQR